MRALLPLCAFLLTTYGAFLPSPTYGQYNPLELLSTPNDGEDSDGESTRGFIASSSSGRYVVFQSDAENLVIGDDNGATDIFLVDRDADSGSKVSLISLDRDDTDSDGNSSHPSISADGRYIVFQSDATDLVANDENDTTDIFIRDTDSDTTTRITIATDDSDADGASIQPRISSDGNFVVFVSVATNLVLDDTNDVADIFLYDRVNDTISRVSVDSDELEVDGSSNSPAINSDGTLIAFASTATDLVLNDTNGFQDIFLRDTSNGGSTSILSNNYDGSPSDDDSFNPFISDDGTLVAFESAATEIVLDDDNGNTDIFLYTVASEENTRVSVDVSGNDGDGDSSNASISADNAFVVFQSTSTDLVLDDNNGLTDIFAYDISEESTVRLSVTDTGIELTNSSTNASINGNGQFVTFQSIDDELVLNDDNMLTDVFSIDTQCLLEPDGVTPGDEDSDSTNDCDDGCPTDENKTELGQCGCGVADTDTDGDGTADCNDECSDDANKTDSGDCGCGVADTDSDGNGVSDCLEFTEGERPRKPVVVYRKRRGILRVIIPLDPPGFRYLVQVRKGKRVIRKRRSGRANIRIRMRGVNGRARVRYKVIGVTKFSRNTRVRLR